MPQRVALVDKLSHNNNDFSENGFGKQQQQQHQGRKKSVLKRYLSILYEIKPIRNNYPVSITLLLCTMKLIGSICRTTVSFSTLM